MMEEKSDLFVPAAPSLTLEPDMGTDTTMVVVAPRRQTDSRARRLRTPV